MSENREAMADLVAILEARSQDYAQAEAELDTSGRTVEQSADDLFETRRGVDEMTAKIARRLQAWPIRACSIWVTRTLEYRMIGPRPDAAPTIVMLHEGLGCVGMWGDFPDKVAAATGCGVFVYSRKGYGKSSPVPLPRQISYMHEEARESLPRVLDAIGFQRGILLGHSDGASIAAIYAGTHQDHRVRGLVLMAPHFIVEDVSVKSIAEAREAYNNGDLRARLARVSSECRCRIPRLERCLAR